MLNWFKKNKLISPHMITTCALMGAAAGAISRDIIVVNNLYTPNAASIKCDFVLTTILLIGLILMEELAERVEKFKEEE